MAKNMLYDFEANGRIYTFEGPEGLDPTAFSSALQQQIAIDNAPKTGGMGEAFKGTAKRMLSSGRTALESVIDPDKAAVAGLERQQAITEKPGGSWAEVQRIYDEQGAIPALWEGIKQAPAVITGQAPQLAGMWGAGKLAAAVTPPVLPVVGPFAKPIAGVLGGLASLAIPQTGTNIERQAQVQQEAGLPVDVSMAKAIPAAVGSAGLDQVALMAGGLGKVLGLSFKELGTVTAQKLAEETLLKAVTKGVGKTALSEMPTEVTQQMLERAQAGLALTTPDAIQEYADAAFQAGLMSPLGGLGGIHARSQAKDKLAAEQALKDQEAADKAYAIEQAKGYRAQAREDRAGSQAVQEEIDRQATETKQQAIDVLQQVAAKKQADAGVPSVNELMQTKEGASQLLTDSDLFEHHFPKAQYNKEDITQIKNDIRARRNTLPSQETIARATRQAELEQTFTVDPNTITPEVMDMWGISKANKKLRNQLLAVGDLTVPDNKVKATEILEDYKQKASPKQFSAAETATQHIASLEPVSMEATNVELNQQADRTGVSVLDEQREVSPAGVAGVEQSALGDVGDSTGLPAGRTEQQSATLEESATNKSDDIYGPERKITVTTEQGEPWTYFGPGSEVVQNNYSGSPAKVVEVLEEQNEQPGYILEIDTSNNPEAVDENGNQINTKRAYITAKELNRLNPPHQSATLEESPATVQARIQARILEKRQAEEQARAEEKAANLKAAQAEQAQIQEEQVNSVPPAIQLPEDSAQALAESQAREAEASPLADNMSNIDEPFVPADENIIASAAGKKKFRKPKYAMPERVEPSDTAATVDAVKKEIGTLFTPQQLKSRPPVVVDTVEELPTHLQEQATKADAAAFVDPTTNQEYYIASKIPSNDIKGKIQHERGAHVGLTKLIGKDRVTALANRVITWATDVNGKKIEHIIAREAHEKALMSGETEGSERYNQEVIAYFTEIAVNRYNIDPLKTQPKEFAKVAGWLRELWNGILGTLKKLHYDPSKLNAKEIVDLVYGAARIANKAEPSADTNIQASAGDKTQSYIADFFDNTAPHPFSNKTRIVNNQASVQLSPQDGQIHINDIMSHAPATYGQQGTGGGRKALNLLTDLADKHGVELNLNPQAYSEKGLSDEQLHSWYTRNGFKDDEYGGMVRKPKAQIQPSAAPQVALKRPDGSDIKFTAQEKEKLWDRVSDVFTGNSPPWRSLMDMLGNKIVTGRYTVERKAIDAGLSATDAKTQGKIRADLIGLQATNAMSLAQAGLFYGKLVLRKSGIIRAEKGNVNMLDLGNEWHTLLEKATKDLGSADLAYDMLSAGWYGPRYEDLAKHNARTAPKNRVDISDWTDSDKNTSAEAWRRYGPELTKLRDMRNEMRGSVLDLMVESGLYTRDVAKEYLDRMDYVPLYRVQDKDLLDKQGRPLRVSTGLLGVGREFKLRGSSKTANDPLQNYIANMSWMMQRAIKNNAAVHTAKMLDALGQGYWAKYKLSTGEKDSMHVAGISINGVEKDFVMYDPNDYAAFAASPIISGLVWDLMRYPVAGLRHGITMMPQFVFNQAVEDPVRAALVSGNKAGVAQNVRDTWKSILDNQFKAERTPDADMLNRYGVIGQKDILDAKDIEDMYHGNDKKGWRSKIYFFERMAQGSDLGARESIYKNAVKELKAEGYDQDTAEDLASIRSQQYMPYQQVGMSKSLAYLRRMMPFVNPPIQGLARDIAAMRGRLTGVSKADGKKMVAFTLTKYAVFTAMYAAFSSGDDDYENKTDDQKDNNFYLGGVRIAVPQELRPLKVAIERGTRYWVLNEANADVDSGAVIGTVLRKSWEIVAGIAVPIPTAARPLLENLTNYDFYSARPVVGISQQGKAPMYQFTDTTSELAKAVGETLNLSPIQIDHILRGYFGYMGQTVSQFISLLDSDRPSLRMQDLPFVGGFVQAEYGTGPKNELYELITKSAEAKTTLKAIQQEGNREKAMQWAKDHRGSIGLSPAINALHNQVTNIRRNKTKIMESTLSPTEKRARLDALEKAELRALTGVHKLHQRMVELDA